MSTSDPLPYDGWRVRICCVDHDPDFPARCRESLRAVLPGAEVRFEVGADARSLSVAPPSWASDFEADLVARLARRVVELVSRGRW